MAAKRTAPSNGQAKPSSYSVPTKVYRKNCELLEMLAGNAGALAVGETCNRLKMMRALKMVRDSAIAALAEVKGHVPIAIDD